MKIKGKVLLRRGLKWGGVGLLCLVFMLLILELFYRYQWIDTYRREITHLNRTAGDKNSRPTCLVMGDSFTANDSSWVATLRRLQPDWHIINSAVPGTGVSQARIMAPGRFASYQPDLFIYQIYVGNDLFDYRYPVSIGGAGFFRSCYWAMANRFRSLSWLNYALGQFTASEVEKQGDPKLLEAGFAPELYNAREKLYLRAEPGLISNQVMLENGREEDMQDYLDELDELLDMAGDIPVLVFVVPHHSQLISGDGYAHLQRLGAELPFPRHFQKTNYPFMMELLLRIKRRKNVHFWNPMPFLDMHQRERPVYYANDPHLNHFGQRKLGEWVDHIFRVMEW